MAWRRRSASHITRMENIRTFGENQGKIVTKEVILEQVWDIDENFVDTHAVTVVINRLRKR